MYSLKLNGYIFTSKPHPRNSVTISLERNLALLPVTYTSTFRIRKKPFSRLAKSYSEKLSFMTLFSSSHFHAGTLTSGQSLLWNCPLSQPFFPVKPEQENRATETKFYAHGYPHAFKSVSRSKEGGKRKPYAPDACEIHDA